MRLIESPFTIFRSLYAHREIILQIGNRDLSSRYKGSLFGILWAFLTPLAMLSIYTFVFSVVLKARWGLREDAGVSDYALILFAGLIPYNIFAEVVGLSPGMVRRVPNYVKKVVFPLEILPLSALYGAIIHSLASIGILIAAMLVLKGEISHSLYLLPLAYIPLVLIILGISWLLSSLGVFIQDLNHSIQLFLQILFWLTPIIYTPEVLPEKYRQFIYWNPLTQVVYFFREALLWGDTFAWNSWLLLTLAGGAFAVLGYSFFVKTKKGFAVVL